MIRTRFRPRILYTWHYCVSKNKTYKMLMLWKIMKGNRIALKMEKKNILDKKCKCGKFRRIWLFLNAPSSVWFWITLPDLLNPVFFRGDLREWIITCLRAVTHRQISQFRAAYRAFFNYSVLNVFCIFVYPLGFAFSFRFRLGFAGARQPNRSEKPRMPMAYGLTPRASLLPRVGGCILQLDFGWAPFGLLSKWAQVECSSGSKTADAHPWRPWSRSILGFFQR